VRKGAALIAVALLIAGCGGGDDGSGDEQAPPPAKAADFPSVDSQRLQDLLTQAGSGPVLAPSAQEFRTGASRLGFALFHAESLLPREVHQKVIADVMAMTKPVRPLLEGTAASNPRSSRVA